MSSLYEQLTGSGGVESGKKEKSAPSPSYYHNSREQSNLSAFQAERERNRREWRKAAGRNPDTGSRWSHPSTNKKSNEPRREKKESGVYDCNSGNYYSLKTDRPYAYQPAREGVAPPRIKEIALDFVVFAAETLLAALGHALMEFFLYSRFRPSIGVKY